MLKIYVKITNRIEAEFMKNRQNGKNMTKPNVPEPLVGLSKLQNGSTLQKSYYKTASFETPFSYSTLFPEPIVANHPLPFVRSQIPMKSGG
jgi:hypothetical protein